MAFLRDFFPRLTGRRRVWLQINKIPILIPIRHGIRESWDRQSEVK